MSTPVKIVVRVTVEGQTGVSRKTFDKEPSAKQALSVLTDALGQVGLIKSRKAK
jgi:hypothetical protein